MNCRHSHSLLLTISFRHTIFFHSLHLFPTRLAIWFWHFGWATVLTLCLCARSLHDESENTFRYYSLVNHFCTFMPFSPNSFRCLCVRRSFPLFTLHLFLYSFCSLVCLYDFPQKTVRIRIVAIPPFDYGECFQWPNLLWIHSVKWNFNENATVDCYINPPWHSRLHHFPPHSIVEVGRGRKRSDWKWFAG